jgi:hypothetical protein
LAKVLELFPINYYTQKDILKPQKLHYTIQKLRLFINIDLKYRIGKKYEINCFLGEGGGCDINH